MSTAQEMSTLLMQLTTVSKSLTQLVPSSSSSEEMEVMVPQVFSMVSLISLLALVLTIPPVTSTLAMQDQVVSSNLILQETSRAL